MHEFSSDVTQRMPRIYYRLLYKYIYINCFGTDAYLVNLDTLDLVDCCSSTAGQLKHVYLY